MRDKLEIVKYVSAQMKAKGLTKSALGEALGATGLSQIKVQRANVFLSTKNEKINMADLMIVAQFLNVSPKEIIIEEKQEAKIGEQLPSYNINPNHLVPLITEKSGEEAIREWLVYPYDNSAHKKITAIAMPDNRMQSEIKKGEILFIDSRIYNFSLSGRLVLAAYNKKFIVGRFNRLKSGYIQIDFANKKYDPVTYSTDNENLEILGVVISQFAAVK